MLRFRERVTDNKEAYDHQLETANQKNQNLSGVVRWHSQDSTDRVAYVMLITVYTSLSNLTGMSGERQRRAGLSRNNTMQLDLTSKRARRLIDEHGLTNEEIQQIVASARINLATFDPEYRANTTRLAEELQKSRPTIYGWADRALVATVQALRQIRAGRPAKDQTHESG